MAETAALAAAVAETAATFAGIEVERAGHAVTYLTRGIAFASIEPDALSFLLPADVTRGALGTPDTAPSARGAGWVRFTPQVVDRFAVDRAQAWFVLAHRSAGQPARGPRAPH